jgi:hypothetical protein
MANMKMTFLKNDRLAGKRRVLVFFVLSWGSCKDNPHQEQGETRSDFVEMNSLFANSETRSCTTEIIDLCMCKYF